MSLRSTILKHSIPLLPTHSFTRHTLSISLSSLPSSHPDHRFAPVDPGVIDTLFGEGTTTPCRALVTAWEEAGLTSMSDDAGSGIQGTGTSKERVKIRLRQRLRYSSRLGEHLVEAYALMSSPSNTHSLPIPRLPESVSSALRGMTLPPAYRPPTPNQDFSSTSSSNPNSNHNAAFDPQHLQQTTSSLVSSFLTTTQHRLPFLAFNPIGPMGYAWRIADEALIGEERGKGVVKDLYGEPAGAGSEWYLSRLALSLAYLSSESHLLQPPPSASYQSASLSASDPGPTSTPPQGQLDLNPHLGKAESSLERNLTKYQDLANNLKKVDGASEGLSTWLSYAANSVKGLIRSRNI